ncbi:MAG: hypothetical protein IPF68_16915 [Bacteroidales bacterium]|nr:hypothetical protein [Bacteroidales bacterium]
MPDWTRCHALLHRQEMQEILGTGSTGLWSIVGANNGVTILIPLCLTPGFNLTSGEETQR